MTFDAFISSGELITVITGVDMAGPAPVLISRTSGTSTVCSPTEISGIPGMVTSFGMVPRREPRRGDNAWWCAFPIAEDAPEVSLSIVLGEQVRSATVRRRVPEPAPVPPPRRTRKPA